MNLARYSPYHAKGTCSPIICLIHVIHDNVNIILHFLSFKFICLSFSVQERIRRKENILPEIKK